MRGKPLKRIMRTAVVLGVFLSVLFLAYSLMGARQQPRAKRPAREKSVKPIWSASAIFSGDMPAQTSPFVIERGRWRLHWETDGPPNSASLSFTVFSVNQALPPILEKNGIHPPDAGTATFRQGGVFYVLVSSYEANWRFFVESSNP